MTELGYRPCVGIMLVNPDGKAFVAERIDGKHGPSHTAGYWQMPQGGVDPGEELEPAALRELAEETGVGADKITLLGKTAEPIRYDLPEELIGKLWKGKYRGQEQVWFLARFNGDDFAGTGGVDRDADKAFGGGNELALKHSVTDGYYRHCGRTNVLR